MERLLSYGTRSFSIWTADGMGQRYFEICQPGNMYYSRFVRPGMRRIAAEAADRLLANPVIESYRIEVAP